MSPAHDDPETGRAFFRDASLFVCALMPAQPGEPGRSALLAFALAREPTAAASEQALEFARHAVARHYAFVFEMLALNSAPWPLHEPRAAANYVVERNGFIALAPSIESSVSMPSMQPHRMVQLLAAWPQNQEADARAFLASRDSCTIIGRVCAIVQCDSGAEIDAVVSSPERLVGGWFAAPPQPMAGGTGSDGPEADVALPAKGPKHAVAATPLHRGTLLNAALVSYVAPFANEHRLAEFLQQHAATSDAEAIRATLDAAVASVSAPLWSEVDGVVWSDAFEQRLRQQLVAQYRWLAPPGLSALLAHARWLCWHEGLFRQQP